MLGAGKRHRAGALALVMAAAVALFGLTTPAGADTGGTGTVTVTATNNAELVMTIADTSAAYGTALQPDGSGTGGEIGAVTGSSASQGAYYIWTPATVPNFTVRSNKPWSGTVSASENPTGSGASASLTVASGALRRCTAAPADYAAASSCTAFTTSAASWASSVAKGTSTYTHYVALRIDWNDDPGTFSSNVVYSVTQ
jgi:hypothetical protein